MASAWRGDIRGNTTLHSAAWQVRCAVEQLHCVPHMHTTRNTQHTQGDAACVKLLLEHAEGVESADAPEGRRLVNATNLTGARTVSEKLVQL